MRVYALINVKWSGDLSWMISRVEFLALQRVITSLMVWGPVVDDFRLTPQLCCSTVQMRYIYTVR